MSEVKKISPVGNIYGWEESQFGEFVLSQDYDALAAEAQALMEEVAALRARVVVVPERELFTQYLPGAIPRNADEVSAWKEGWNDCRDELARLNGVTVSVGLLRRVCAEPPATCCMDDEMTWRRDRDSALTELRALLNQDKENGDHAA
ncbi:hypothetical protein D0Y56_10865 [Pseudomonas aeruginosa]|uniref:hypothetical protein n=1 Tax=Pseudomonas aeruginosa TaxID=287 RepID=UPI000EB72313|nr:hypothetical protein [Pseudomonas aeruginosa]AXS87434.1 hypothetical protein D0Y56_10865 [Pseudomonas aeruginosa]